MEVKIPALSWNYDDTPTNQPADGSTNQQTDIQGSKGSNTSEKKFITKDQLQDNAGAMLSTFIRRISIPDILPCF